MSNEITRDDKLKALNISDKSIQDKYIDLIYNEFIIKKNKKIPTKIIKSQKIIDTTTDKCVLLLKLVNKLLVSMSKTDIDDLTEFVNIDRSDIILCDKAIILTMENELFKSKIFSKPQGWYRKKAASYNLNILRSLVKDVGLKLVQIKKSIYAKEDGKPCLRTRIFYSIKNI